MDFGLLFAFRNPPPVQVPFAELYGKQFDLAVLAEDLGYDTIWLTEHHFIDDGYSPSLLPIAAAVAARTRRIRIGTFVILLPLHNALRIAEDAATVDIISNGRFDLGVGQGYRIPEFVGFDIPRRERGARLQEGAEVIRRAWTEKNHVRGPLQQAHRRDGRSGSCPKAPPADLARGAWPEVNRAGRPQRLSPHGHGPHRAAAGLRRRTARMRTQS
jgi:alkanesulfonate monooxygenase SsuD/methylene tetrahydromethanopterin reductase-like flavin-dependent oxidoreductase (luciferase family)